MPRTFHKVPSTAYLEAYAIKHMQLALEYRLHTCINLC